MSPFLVLRTLFRRWTLFAGRRGDRRFWLDAATTQLLLLQELELLVWGKRGRIHGRSNEGWW